MQLIRSHELVPAHESMDGQRRAEFVGRHGREGMFVKRVLDLLSEVGEVAREGSDPGMPFRRGRRSASSLVPAALSRRRGGGTTFSPGPRPSTIRCLR